MIESMITDREDVLLIITETFKNIDKLKPEYDYIKKDNKIYINIESMLKDIDNDTLKEIIGKLSKDSQEKIEKLHHSIGTYLNNIIEFIKNKEDGKK